VRGFILSPLGRGDQEVLFSEQENLTEAEIFIPFLEWDKKMQQVHRINKEKKGGEGYGH
jgi:hypothetical protein